MLASTRSAISLNIVAVKSVLIFELLNTLVIRRYPADGTRNLTSKTQSGRSIPCEKFAQAVSESGTTPGLIAGLVLISRSDEYNLAIQEH